MPEKVNIIISTEESADLKDVAARLRQAGMDVTGVMETVGTISGSIRPDALSSLVAVRGVTHVERERAIQIPPPDSGIQ